VSTPNDTFAKIYGDAIPQWIKDLGNLAINNGHVTRTQVADTERLIQAGVDLAANFSGIKWGTLESLG
jgi:hypothetical protein